MPRVHCVFSWCRVPLAFWRKPIATAWPALRRDHPFFGFAEFLVTYFLLFSVLSVEARITS
jgi:hypothetical protein